MYVHVCIAFHPCMCVHVNRQLKPYAVYLNISCHNSHSLYRHVYTCQHQLQPRSILSCTSLMSMHIYTKVKSSMDMHVRVNICAFDLSTKAWVHVNRQHYASSTITSMCAYMSALASTQVIMCAHRQQPVRLFCVHVHMYAHSFNPCMCVHVNRQPKPYAVS